LAISIKKIVTFLPVAALPSHDGHYNTTGDTMVKANLLTADRIVRIVTGAGMLAIALIMPQADWGYLGLVPLISGLVGFCPVCCLLPRGKCTNPKD
jgi:hypothetical protein